MPAISYSHAVRVNALVDPERPALTDDCGTLSRAEVDRQVDRVARQLLAEGVAHGSTVALSGSNSARLLVLAFAIWRIGAVPLPIHGRKAREDLEALLALAKPALAVGFDDTVASDGKRQSIDALYEAARCSAELPPLPTEALSPNSRIGVSGGSTGRSKLIVVDAPALLNPDRPWHHGMERDGVHVVPLELVDGTGFVSATTAFALGCHQVVMNTFDPETLLRLIDAHEADWLALTPPLMLQVWKLGPERRARYHLSSLRCVTHYSGGVAPWLKHAWIDWLGPERIVESYGATDARGSTWIDGVTWLERPGAVGLPGRGSEVAIFDEGGKPVAPGSVGDIYIRDLTGRRNYHYIGAEAEALPGGWETVGDVGWMDEDGYLYVGDRRKDLIRGAAGPLFPSEIEGAIERHEAVRSAVAVGLPPADDGGAERIHVFVDAPYAALGADELRAFLSDTLRPEQLPASIDFVDRPLRDHAGKALRAKLRRDRIETKS